MHSIATYLNSSTFVQNTINNNNNDNNNNNNSSIYVNYINYNLCTILFVCMKLNKAPANFLKLFILSKSMQKITICFIYIINSYTSIQ